MRSNLHTTCRPNPQQFNSKTASALVSRLVRVTHQDNSTEQLDRGREASADIATCILAPSLHQLADGDSEAETETMVYTLLVDIPRQPAQSVAASL